MHFLPLGGLVELREGQPLDKSFIFLGLFKKTSFNDNRLPSEVFHGDTAECLAS